MSESYKFGPFRNDEPESNVPAYRNPAPTPRPNYEAFREETVEYFTARQKRLKVLKTTKTARGQILDWIPIESQHPKGKIASPPPRAESHDTLHADQPEQVAIAELDHHKCERGPSGSVPILRKKLDALGYTKPLRQYLAKYRGEPLLDFGGLGVLPPGPGRGTHWHGNSSQKVMCWGGEGQFSCFDPYTDSSEEFSLIQIGLSNSDLPLKQTVEAGWQEYQDILGDWVPHLFVYYTTNGHTHDDDNQGGYNTDVDGWVQFDDTIFPGTTFLPYSEVGGPQRKISIKYQHFRDNWWLSVQGRWVGYYPGKLFMGNQSIFATLGDHADRIGFWGEVATFNTMPTKTDMGSGHFGSEGWTKAAYFHHLRIQSDRNGGMSAYNGIASATNKDLYDIDAHMNSGTAWGSFAFVGGPGAG